VGGAVDGAVARQVLRDTWWHRIEGQWWAGWFAWRSFFRDECDLELPSGLWDSWAAYEAANSAGWWWPHRQFVIVAERPTQISLEQIGPRGWRSHQLHRADGPAISWTDGWAVSYWHGVAVPGWVTGADGGPTLARIQAEKNTEVRRCAIEAYGWDRYLSDIGSTPVDVADDPGNPGQVLRLFDLPREAQVYPAPVRLLVMTNASVDRGSRERRVFAETVPVECAGAVDAAAWQFGVTPDRYRRLQRAS
jgi:hypothetical protein